jgi:16S rRNA (guanine527-N7)-methyltransferase
VDGLDQFGLKDLSEPLLRYLLLLQKWNQAYNLTAIRDMDEMVTRHVLDSLAILPWVKGERVLDVGSGAGFPGIPLKLARPELHVVLLDSNGKKCRFLNEVARVLSISGIEIVQSRVENYLPALHFDTVTCRAFSDVAQTLKWTGHLIREEGVWLLMKGRDPLAETSSIEHPYRIESYAVKGIDGARSCVIVENKKE